MSMIDGERQPTADELTQEHITRTKVLSAGVNVAEFLLTHFHAEEVSQPTDEDIVGPDYDRLRDDFKAVSGILDPQATFAVSPEYFDAAQAFVAERSTPDPV